MDRPADVLPERAWIALAALSVAAAAAINIGRIQFGVDFTDESFYATLATAIARDGRALIDEWNLAQFAAYPLVPKDEDFEARRLIARDRARSTGALMPQHTKGAEPGQPD